MNAIADRAGDVTPEWLTKVLRAGGAELVVASAETAPVGTGQMGFTYRVRLTYEGPAGPPTMIVKLAAGAETARQAVAMGYRAEVGFYQHLATQVDVRAPHCWHAAIADDGRFTLLLDDVVGSVAGVQAHGCSLGEAQAALGNLVGLHASTWKDPSLRDRRFLMRADAVAAHMGQILAPAVETFIEQYKDELDGDDQATLRGVGAAIGQWRRGDDEPFALIHGDYRLDNLLFSGTSEATAIDWQSAALGPPLRDVAYFLGNSLDQDVRAANEERLVAEYHRGLLAGGVTDYPLDQCWREYRLGQFQGPMVTVIGCTYATGLRTADSDEMFLAMARRSCAAIRDLDSLALLPRS